MSSDHDAGPPRGPLPMEQPDGEPSAWRLTFTYDGSDIRLVAQQRVAMIAPPDDSPRTYAARAGTWVELRDASGHGLYRQQLADPVRRGYEAHSPDAGSHQVEPEDPSGVFQVVVPDLEDAVDVVLHRLPDEAVAPGAPRAARAADRATAEPVLTEALGETPPYEVT